MARRWQRIVLAAGLAVAIGGAGYGWTTSPDGPAGHESVALELETAQSFRDAWNSGDARAIASRFLPEVRDEIAEGLPGFVRGAGFGSGWPEVSPGRSEREGESMTIDYPVLAPRRAVLLETDWEWRDGRWTLIRIDFGRDFR